MNGKMKQNKTEENASAGIRTRVAAMATLHDTPTLQMLAIIYSLAIFIATLHHQWVVVSPHMIRVGPVGESQPECHGG